MSKELEALNDLLLLSKLSDGAKKGMPALKRADYNAHIIYRALERAKKVEELKDLFMRLANNNYLMYQTDNPIFANKRTILLHEINEKEKELGELK